MKKVTKEEVKKVEEVVCEACKGSGCGPLVGVKETTCEKCEGTGK